MNPGANDFWVNNASSVVGAVAVVNVANALVSGASSITESGKGHSILAGTIALGAIAWKEIADAAHYKGGIDMVDLFGGAVAIMLYVAMAKLQIDSNGVRLNPKLKY